MKVSVAAKSSILAPGMLAGLGGVVARDDELKSESLTRLLWDTFLPQNAHAKSSEHS